MNEECFNALQQRDDLSEVSQVFHFFCVRRTKDGRPQGLDIEICDRGPGSPHTRYHATVRERLLPGEDREPKAASGNSDDSIQTVLATLHWWDLD